MAQVNISLIIIIMTFIMLTFNNSLFSFCASSSNKPNSLERKDKIKRLSACLKLSKTRQEQDAAYYNNLLSYVDKSSTSENRIGDFIALTIVTCYKEISDETANDILEDQDLYSKNEDFLELLKLEKWFEVYKAEKLEEVEDEILKMQEKVLEVISLSKEAEVLQQEYYNIKYEPIKVNKMSFLQKLLFALLPENTEFIKFFQLSFVNLIYAIVFGLIIVAIINGFKRKQRGNNNDNGKGKGDKVNKGGNSKQKNKKIV